METLIFIIIIVILLILIKRKNESFGWSCSFTPSVDYYKENWLLGGNEMAQAAARDAIKPIYF